MTASYLEIDNPGGGDCGFYAVAIGIIVLIQRQLNEGIGSPPLLKLFLEKSRIANFQNRIESFNLYEQDRYLLDDFNNILRMIIYEDKIKKIKAAFDSNDLFNDITFSVLFSEVYDVFSYYYEGGKKNFWKNDFFRDDHFNNEMKVFVEYLKRLENQIGIKLKNDKKKNELSEEEINYIMAYFFSDPTPVRNEETSSFEKKLMFQENSLVDKVLKKKIMQRTYATSEELVVLKDLIACEIAVFSNGEELSISNSKKCPIKINNQRNVHWTTYVDPFHDATNISRHTLELRKFAVTINLTKQEIKNVINTYTRNDNLLFRLFHFELGKTQLPYARTIVSMCDDPTKSVQDIMTEIKKNPPTNLKDDGDFIKFLRYLSLRYDGTESLISKKEKKEMNKEKDSGLKV